MFLKGNCQFPVKMKKKEFFNVVTSIWQNVSLQYTCFHRQFCMDFPYSGPSKRKTRKSCLVCMEWEMEGLLVWSVWKLTLRSSLWTVTEIWLLSYLCFTRCHQSIVWDFFCFARLVDVPIPIYSFSYDIGETELCPHDLRGKSPEVHPKLSCLSIKLGQMCLHDLPSSTPLVPRDFMPGWSAM